MQQQQQLQYLKSSDKSFFSIAVVNSNMWAKTINSFIVEISESFILKIVAMQTYTSV